MSDDLDALVKRLNRADLYEGSGEGSDLPEEAAATITQLRADLAAANGRAEKAEADKREMAMQSLADLGQAQEAYEAQLRAEADAAALRARIREVAQDVADELASSDSAHVRDVANSVYTAVIAALAPAMPEGE